MHQAQPIVVELVPPVKGSPLPGEAVDDPELLDRVVNHVNRLFLAKGLETAREVGEYLLRQFFGGNPENFHQRGRKHVSFRRLAERKDLQPSYSFLWSACAVVEQLRLLPANLSETLPLSHHKLLLSVKDRATKVRLAQLAAERGLSKRALEEEVRTLRSRTGVRAGRRPLPSVVKGLGRLTSAVKFATDGAVTAESFSDSPHGTAENLLAELNDNIEALQILKRQIQEAMAEQEHDLS